MLKTVKVSVNTDTFAANGNDQDIMAARTDDHTPSAVTPRAKTQPGGFEQFARFSGDSRWAKRGLIVCSRSHDALILCL